MEAILDFPLHFQFDVRSDILEKPDRNIELAERLDVVVHVNLALFDLITLRFEQISDITVRDGSVQRFVFTGLPADHKLQFLDQLLELIGIVLLSGFFRSRF